MIVESGARTTQARQTNSRRNPARLLRYTAPFSSDTTKEVLLWQRVLLHCWVCFSGQLA